MDTKALRKSVRKQRRALSPEQQSDAVDGLNIQLQKLADIKQANDIGLYLVNDGEIDPIAFMHWAWEQGKRCFLPVLAKSDNQAMRFAQITSESQFSCNRFNIPEPRVDTHQLLDADKLDVILLPLVVFDLKGNRLGMGGGYYDRTLAFTRQRPYYQRPKLIGLAFEFQCVPELTPSPWDIPLDGCATEMRAQLF